MNPDDASTTGSNATEERGSKDANASFVITRELRSLERQRVPGIESAEGFLDPEILNLNTTE